MSAPRGPGGGGPGDQDDQGHDAGGGDHADGQAGQAAAGGEGGGQQDQGGQGEGGQGAGGQPDGPGGQHPALVVDPGVGLPGPAGQLGVEQQPGPDQRGGGVDPVAALEQDDGVLG